MMMLRPHQLLAPRWCERYHGLLERYFSSHSHQHNNNHNQHNNHQQSRAQQQLSPELIEEKLKTLREMFAGPRLQLIPFTAPLNLQLTDLHWDFLAMRFDFSPQLVGNPFRQTLHGGCVGAVLDQCAGMAAVTAYALRDPVALTVERYVNIFSHVGTIDLRVDYIAPGRGRFFVASADAVAVRNKIITTQTKLVNDEERLIALGTASFFIDPKHPAATSS
jgi:acyl-coenzyme A thioesterase PaaI-like protein